MPRLLLLLPAAGYANRDFIAAAARLDIELVACADYCHRLAPGWPLPPRARPSCLRPRTGA